MHDLVEFAAAAEALIIYRKDDDQFLQVRQHALSMRHVAKGIEEAGQVATLWTIDPVPMDDELDVGNVLAGVIPRRWLASSS